MHRCVPRRKRAVQDAATSGRSISLSSSNGSEATVILTTDEFTATWYHTHRKQYLMSNLCRTILAGVAPSQWPDHYLSLTNVGLALQPNMRRTIPTIRLSMPVSLMRLTALPSSMNRALSRLGQRIASLDNNDNAHGMLARESHESGLKQYHHEHLALV